MKQKHADGGWLAQPTQPIHLRMYVRNADGGWLAPQTQPLLMLMEIVMKLILVIMMFIVTKR